MIATQLALLRVLAIAAVHTSTVHLCRALRGAAGDGRGQRHNRASTLGRAFASGLAASLQQVSASRLTVRGATIVARLLARNVEQQAAQVQTRINRALVASQLAVVLQTSAAAVLARQRSLQMATQSAGSLGQNAANCEAALLAAQRARASTSSLKIFVTRGLFFEK